jgi:hypothetical protein
MLKPEQVERIYLDTMRDLKGIIETSEGSLAAFCRKYDIDRPNLSRIFSENNSSEMSVGMYQRICVALGIIPESAVCNYHVQITNLSLKHYLLIDNNAIRDSINIIAFK